MVIRENKKKQAQTDRLIGVCDMLELHFLGKFCFTLFLFLSGDVCTLKTGEHVDVNVTDGKVAPCW